MVGRVGGNGSVSEWKIDGGKNLFPLFGLLYVCVRYFFI